MQQDNPLLAEKTPTSNLRGGVSFFRKYIIFLGMPDPVNQECESFCNLVSPDAIRNLFGVMRHLRLSLSILEHGGWHFRIE